MWIQIYCTVLYCSPYCLVVSYMPPPQHPHSENFGNFLHWRIGMDLFLTLCWSHIELWADPSCRHLSVDHELAWSSRLADNRPCTVAWSVIIHSNVARKVLELDRHLLGFSVLRWSGSTVIRFTSIRWSSIGLSLLGGRSLGIAYGREFCLVNLLVSYLNWNIVLTGMLQGSNLTCPHCKKRLAFFPSPAGMWYATNQTLSGRKLLNYSRPERVWLVTSRLRTGKTINFFLQCEYIGAWVQCFSPHLWASSKEDNNGFVRQSSFHGGGQANSTADRKSANSWAHFTIANSQISTKYCITLSQNNPKRRL